MPFEVKHKPGYRIKIRVGVDSGPCAAGVVGDKIPHYSVFGETVELAGLMEATCEPMKVQVRQFNALSMDYMDRYQHSEINLIWIVCLSVCLNKMEQ